MPADDITSIKAILKSTTLKDCLQWFRQSGDEEVSAALKPLLFDKESGAVRVVADDILREELLAIVRKHDVLRRFVADKFQASLDRITAQYLEEQIGRS